MSKKKKQSNKFILRVLSENYPLLIILVGVTLVSLSIGPFNNWDMNIEFQAANGVIKWGLPFVNGVGDYLNQPPLGFYSEAAFFKIFGSSMNLGTLLVTAFGLVSTVLVYLIGKEIYGKPTGVFAAALFAFAPWELVLTRSFLIDVECLMLSLACFYIGILAIRRDSLKYYFISGVLFAAAFLTKQFVVFILIPLLIFFIYFKPKNLKSTFTRISVFIAPVILFFCLWYFVVVGRDFFFALYHTDFRNSNDAGVTPSLTFASTFLWNYGLGYLFVVATALSLVVLLLFRKDVIKENYFDLIGLATIIIIVVTETVLGAGLNLKAPYFNAVKYLYFVLPFFSLIAASLINKSQTLVKAKTKTFTVKRLCNFIAILSVFLFILIFFADFYSAHQFSLTSRLVFRMDLNIDSGYTFFNTPIDQRGFLMGLQYFGFGFSLFGLFLAIKAELSSLFEPMKDWIRIKNSKVTNKSISTFNN